MKSSIDEFVSIIDRLTARLDELEGRILALEQHSGAQAQAVAPQPPVLLEHPLAQVSRSSNVMPVIGKIFLGMAGAYLLRALAESSAMPGFVVAGMALAYAGAWIVWAARTPPAAVFAGTAYASIAAVILPPMLWELTLRFKVMPARVAAGVLVGFVACATTLAWKRKLASVVWTPTVSAALAALALLLGTRDPLPFLAALLLIALITEAAASSGRWLSVRPLVALPVDLGILALMAIYTSANGAAPDYRPLGLTSLLRLFAAPLVIYTASIVAHSVSLRRKICGFEIAQMTVVFLLACVGILRVTHGAAGFALGVFCLLAAGACYWCAFARFGEEESRLGHAEKEHSLRRNHYVFSIWAALLAITGSLLAFPASVNSLWLGAAALAAIWTGMRRRRLSLAVHGAAYLAALAVVSGLLEYAIAVSMGGPPAAGWTVWSGYLFTLLCCDVAWSGFGRASSWQEKTLTVSLAAFAVWTTLSGTMAIALSMLPAAGAGRTAAARTLIICIFAVLLGWSGIRWRRAELAWLAYGCIALATVKLLFEDLRTGSASAIAFSLFCYGMAWVLARRK